MTGVFIIMAVIVVALLPLYMRALGDDEPPDIPDAAME